MGWSVNDTRRVDCASLRRFLQAFNDALGDIERQSLLPLLPRLTQAIKQHERTPLRIAIAAEWLTESLPRLITGGNLELIEGTSCPRDPRDRGDGMRILGQRLEEGYRLLSGFRTAEGEVKARLIMNRSATIAVASAVLPGFSDLPKSHSSRQAGSGWAGWAAAWEYICLAEDLSDQHAFWAEEASAIEERCLHIRASVWNVLERLITC